MMAVFFLGSLGRECGVNECGVKALSVVALHLVRSRPIMNRAYITPVITDEFHSAAVLSWADTGKPSIASNGQRREKLEQRAESDWQR